MIIIGLFAPDLGDDDGGGCCVDAACVCVVIFTICVVTVMQCEFTYVTRCMAVFESNFLSSYRFPRFGLSRSNNLCTCAPNVRFMLTNCYSLFFTYNHYISGTWRVYMIYMDRFKDY